MIPAPVPLRYEGDGTFQAASKYVAAQCDKHYVVGEVLPMEPAYERSQASHNHQFADIAEKWATLPERYSREPWARSAEHLRKFALIMTRFCTVEAFPCGTKAEAKRWATNLRNDDEFCMVEVRGTSVVRYRAESQSKRAMGATRFQESKQAVLDYIDGLLDPPPLVPEQEQEEERETA